MHFSTRLSQRSRFTLCLRDGIPSSFPLRKLRTRDETSFAKKKKKEKNIAKSSCTAEMAKSRNGDMRKDIYFTTRSIENYFTLPPYYDLDADERNSFRNLNSILGANVL